MREKIKKIFFSALKNDLIKVFSLTALSTSVKMVTALITTKVVAIIVGPSGVALLGQLTNFVTIILNLASGGINNAITKYIAEYKESDSKITALLSTAFRIIAVCSVVAAVIMVLFNERISRWILFSEEYGFVFVVFGLTVIFYAINNMLISAVNGFKCFRLYTILNIAGSILGVIFSVIFVLTMGLSGAMIATVTYQSIVLGVTVVLLRKELWFKISRFTDKLNKKIFWQFLKFSLASIVFIVSAPISQMLLRGYVIADISESQAGIWEGMNRISMMYMMVISMSLTVYYIPRLSELHTKEEIREEIIKAYKFLVPLLLVGFVLVYFLRHIIIWILYTPDFVSMERLFGWQLLLDMVKAVSFVVAYLLIAKAKVFIYTVTTLVFSALYLSVGYILLRIQNDVVGIIQGELLTQTLYFITIVFILRKTLFRRYYKFS